jgi:molybdopterin synthase sulfur carrier subunit
VAVTGGDCARADFVRSIALLDTAADRARTRVRDRHIANNATGDARIGRPHSRQNQLGICSAMAKVFFTANIQRHVVCPDTEAAGRTLREVLDNVFSGNSQARSYVLDDQSALRRHMTIFVDGATIRDRVHLSDPVTEGSRVHVFQALSGG